jgi:hypothetical protein
MMQDSNQACVFEITQKMTDPSHCASALAAHCPLASQSTLQDLQQKCAMIQNYVTVPDIQAFCSDKQGIWDQFAAQIWSKMANAPTQSMLSGSMLSSPAAPMPTQATKKSHA